MFLDRRSYAPTSTSYLSGVDGRPPTPTTLPFGEEKEKTEVLEKLKTSLVLVTNRNVITKIFSYFFYIVVDSSPELPFY